MLSSPKLTRLLPFAIYVLLLMGIFFSLAKGIAAFVGDAENSQVKQPLVSERPSVPVERPANLLLPSLTVSKTDTLQTDNDGDGAAGPGDVLRYTIVVDNSGGSEATGVTLTDVLDQYTTYITDSLRVTPLAIGDSYNAIGNTRITITPTNGLLANDIDPDDPAPNPAFNEGLTVSAFDVSSTNGGDVSVSADGSFTYDPPAGFEGSDSFSYTITDGDGLTAVGTVTVTVSDVIWYVDNTAAAGGDGRSQTPFNTLPNTIGNADDFIFVRENGGGSYPATLTLASGQQLIGHDFGPADFAAVTGLTQPLGTTFPTPGSSPTLTSSGDALTLGSNNSVRGLTIGDTTGTGLTGTNFGTLTVRDVTITGTGAILNLDTGTLDATFDSLTTTSSTTTGIGLTDVGGSLTAVSGSIAGTSSIAFNVNGGTATISYSGSISQSAAARIVQVQNRPAGAGTITLSGNLTCNTSCTGINVASNSGGTISFSGGSKVLNTATNPAVTLSSNSGTTINFNNGGLDVDTTTATGFSATGGGTVNVTGSGNHVDTTTGTGVNIANTTIGSSGVTFESVSVNGATTGIALNDTGTVGFFTVSGDGSTAGSGGIIQNTTSDAITLATTQDVAFHFMNITGSDANGIHGSNVTGFTLNSSLVQNNGDAVNEGGLRFDQNLLGTVTISDATIRASAEHNIEIINTSATPLTLTVTDSTVSDTALSGLGADGLLLETRSSANASVTVTDSTFSNNVSDGIQISAIDSSTASLTVEETDGGTSFFSDGARGLNLSAASNATLSFNVTDTSFDNFSPSLGEESINLALVSTSTASSSLTGVIDNNTFSNTGGAVGVDLRGNGIATLEVSNNTMTSAINREVIDVITGDATGDSATLNLTALNNSLVSQSRDAFFIEALEATSLCLNVRDNSATPGSGDDAYVIFGDTTTGATQLESGPTDCGGSACTDAVDHITSNNTGVPVTVFDVSLVSPGTCSTPSTVATASFLDDLDAYDSHLETTGNSLPAAFSSMVWFQKEPGADHESPLIVRSTGLAKPLFAPSAAASLATPGDTVTLLGDPFTLPAGETFTVTFAVTITTPLPGGVDSVQNQATVSGSNFSDVLSVDPAPNPGFPPTNGETITPLTVPVDLEISKDDGQTTAVPGTAITYTVIARNNGPNGVNGATVTDSFPAALNGVSWICTASGGGACPPSGSGDINDTVDLAVGSSVTYTVNATIDSAATGTLVNTAAITETTISSDPSPGNNSATDTDTLTPEADITVAKTDSPDPVLPGETLVYTVTVSNTGPSIAQNVVLTDTLPADVTLVSTSGCAEDPAGVPTCSLGTMVASSSAQVVMTTTVSPAASGTLTNSATVGSTTPDPETGNNTVSIETAILETDFGDAPDPSYPTLLASNGARHYTTGPFLGVGVDGENDGQPNATATGDNDDGVTFTTALVRGHTAAVEVVASAACTLSGWVDFNADGDWADAGEDIFPGGTALTAGSNSLNVSVPAGATLGTSFARFRCTTDGAVSFTGLASDGEVEDYQVEIVDNAFSIGDVTLSEGNSGTTLFTFTITRTENSTASSVDYATSDGTAVAGTDYTAVPTTTVNFTAGGAFIQTVDVAVSGDTLFEENESFSVILSNPVNGGLGDSEGLGTIVNDDAPPALSVADVTAVETAGTFPFTVTLSAISGLDASVSYSTADETAVSGSDYTAANGALTIPAGSTSGVIEVTVLDDALVEGTETFTLTLSNPSNATLGDGAAGGIILDDESLLAFNDAYTTTANIPLTVPVPGVLGNDNDGELTGLTAVLDTLPANGTLDLNADGSFIYTPTLNFNGTDSFSYHLTDGVNDSNTAVVSITVLPDIKSDTVVYLPLVFNNEVQAPDLVVQKITVLSDDKIEVTIANVGDASVQQAFWVDLYIDPEPLPTAVNQIWPEFSTEGLVWGVTDVSPLSPGGILVLNSVDAEAQLSNYSGSVGSGTVIAVQVDSANAGSAFGAVLEDHEIFALPYNNILTVTVP